jgi:hypothetical protein
MENRRIAKAVNQGNDFKRDWFLAEAFQRSNNPMFREVGVEMMNELLQQWKTFREKIYVDILCS